MFLKYFSRDAIWRKNFFGIDVSNISNLLTASSKKLLTVSAFFWSSQTMVSFSIRAILVDLRALLERKGVFVFQNPLLFVISH